MTLRCYLVGTVIVIIIIIIIIVIKIERLIIVQINNITVN